MADTDFSDLIAEYDFVVDDLSVWEIINPSSSEAGESSDGDFSVGDENSDEAAVIGAIADEIQEEAPLDVGSPSSDVSMEDSVGALVRQLDGNGDGNCNGTGDGDAVSPEIIAAIDAAVDAFNGRYTYRDGVPYPTIGGGVGDSDDEYSEEEHDSYDDEYEYGDSLFPYSSSNKYGRQRAKKSGKKIIQKPKKGGKKQPCRFGKRCVYGKDGSQHSYL